MRRFVPIFLVMAVVLAGAQSTDESRALVIRRWANVRTGPSTSSSVLRRVYEGEEFEVLEITGDWIRIRIDERAAGWIFHELVKVSQPGPSVDAESSEGATVSDPREWVYVPVLLLCAVGGAALVYWGLSRHQKLFDYSGRLDRMTSSGYIDSVSRDDVVRLTKAFGVGDRSARAVARQTYLDRYRVSSTHQKLTDKEKASFRKLQAVLQLTDEDVMRIMARVYKTKRRGERAEL